MCVLIPVRATEEYVRALNGIFESLRPKESIVGNLQSNKLESDKSRVKCQGKIR